MMFRQAAAVAVLASAGLLQAPSAAQDAPARAAAASPAALPDWTGIWIGEGVEPEISGFPSISAPLNYKILADFAPWSEAGRARMMQIVGSAGPRKAEGWGYPMMMSSAAPLQFIVTPEQTLIVNAYRDIRHIHTDGRPLPPEEDRWPTVWGESVARWEGDTLVIETVSVATPYDYFFSAPPLSPNARYLERIRKTGPDRIEVEMTIEDPEMLSKPWEIKAVLVRAQGLDRLIHDTYTNDRSEVQGEHFTIVPPDQP